MADDIQIVIEEEPAPAPPTDTAVVVAPAVPTPAVQQADAPEVVRDSAGWHIEFADGLAEAARAKRLAAAGTRELLLIAQDSTYYGLDLYGKRRLADLLKALSDVEGIGWIRLHYAFPTGFPSGSPRTPEEQIANHKSNARKAAWRQPW